MLTFPNAKINIGLFITGKRDDGFHNLETIFYPVAAKDALEILDSKEQESSIKITGLEVDGDLEKNLVWKAFMLLQNDFPEQISPIDIHLHKLIPMGAGLGGGSADGAFMLNMLNDYFHLNINETRLEQYALLLGSDCPFFIKNKPAFASGRGEIMEPLSLDLGGYDIQIICPQLHISTAVAFSNIKPSPAIFDLRNISTLPIETWKSLIKNDFEATVFPQFPVLKNIKDQLYEQGALYASMSGTGSALFGIFPKGKRAEILTDILFHSVG